MNHEKCSPNYSIKCTVTSCANHCGSDDYCALDCICIEMCIRDRAYTGRCYNRLRSRA